MKSSRYFKIVSHSSRTRIRCLLLIYELTDPHTPQMICDPIVYWMVLPLSRTHRRTFFKQNYTHKMKKINNYAHRTYANALLLLCVSRISFIVFTFVSTALRLGPTLADIYANACFDLTINEICATTNISMVHSRHVQRKTILFRKSPTSMCPCAERCHCECDIFIHAHTQPQRHTHTPFDSKLNILLFMSSQSRHCNCISLLAYTNKVSKKVISVRNRARNQLIPEQETTNADASTA